MWGLAEIKKMNDEAVKRANADNQGVLESIRVICPLYRTNFPATYVPPKQHQLTDTEWSKICAEIDERMEKRLKKG